MNTIGVANIAPAIMAVGSQEQKDRFLRPMLRGDEIWCQGMSEPDAGSDLASLRTSAEADGDGFIVNGQKTWNSLGERADWCQLYVRTDPSAPKHKGISCLLVDMRTPGIEVRPLRTMAGETTFSELFFDDVGVPGSALLGPIHEGWRVAMTTLSHERAGVARLHLGLRARLTELLEEARGPGRADPVQRDRLARLYARSPACGRPRPGSWRRSGTAASRHPPWAAWPSSMWAHAEQELAELAVGLFGRPALRALGQAPLASPGVSIAGGPARSTGTSWPSTASGFPGEYDRRREKGTIMASVWAFRDATGGGEFTQ